MAVRYPMFFDPTLESARALAQTPASFIVYKELGVYFVKDGRTGEIKYKGTDANEAIQTAIDLLTYGRTWEETILLKGNFGLRTTVRLPNYVILDFSRARLYAEDGFTPDKHGTEAMIRNEDVDVAGNEFITLILGQLDGRKAVQVKTFSGIFFRFVRNVNIIGGHVHNFNAFGIFVSRRANAPAFTDQSSNVRVEGVYAEQCDWDNLAYTSDGGQFVNCHSRGSSLCGLTLEESRHCTVAGGLYEDNGEFGMDVIGSTDIEIAMPICRRNKNGGIGVGPSAVAKPSDINVEATCLDNFGHGFYGYQVRNLSLYVIARENEDHGVRITGGAAQSYNLMVRGVVKDNKVADWFIDGALIPTAEVHHTLAKGAGVNIVGNAGTTYVGLTASHMWLSVANYISKYHAIRAELVARWEPRTTAGGLRLYNDTDATVVATLEPGVTGWRRDVVDITVPFRGWDTEKTVLLETKGDGTTAPLLAEIFIRVIAQE